MQFHVNILHIVEIKILIIYYIHVKMSQGNKKKQTGPRSEVIAKG